MKEQLILSGVLCNSPSLTHSGRIYHQEDFNKALSDYERKSIYDKRRKIIEKLLKNE